MKLALTKSAGKVLDALQPKLAALMDELAAIAADPFGPHPRAKRLHGGRDEFRLRHGGRRVLYLLDRGADTMIVTAVETRGEAYKK